MCANILIVDDDTDMCKLLSNLLEDKKYHVELASSAEEALEKLEESDFDLIISDIYMSGMNGVELLKKIREMEIDSDFILITAYGSVNTAVESMKLGALHYIEKPINFGKFKNLAIQILNERYFRRSFVKDKLLVYTLSRAIFDTENLSVEVSPAKQYPVNYKMRSLMNVAC